jgi:predicted TIM-barrel fold metal-dependent hydrolase
LPVRSARPYGNRIYHPLYAAAVRHNLVVGLHFGGSPGNPPTPAGWPSYYIEEYAGIAQIFQSQLISLIAEGVFDQFPTLRVALIESGVTWLPALMWRLDKEWRGLRREIPWVKKRPSDYIRQHIRLTTQPLDAPPRAGHLLQIIHQLECEELLMFSSDYPHHYPVSPMETWLSDLQPVLTQKIMAENARAFYQW